MITPFRKSSIVVTSVALGCFVAGFAGTGGAHEFQRTVAVNQAFDAAREVQDKREALEESLLRAQSLADQAAPVADDTRVKSAAKSLSTASTEALAVASDNAVALDAEPVALPADSTDKIAAPDETAIAAPASPQVVSKESTDIELADVVNDSTVEQVLEGEDTGLSAARGATEKLNDVGVALDAALAEVEAHADGVKDATDQASLSIKLRNLDLASAKVSSVTASANEVLDTIGLRVLDAASLTAVQDAISALDQARGGARNVERIDLEAVASALDSLENAEDALESAVDAATASYAAWIDSENDRRDTVNQQAELDHKEAVMAAREAYSAQNLEFAASRSHGWSGKPAEIEGSNGRLDRSTLCEVDFAPGHLLQCDAGAALADADRAYHDETGRHLVMTDSYRSYALQVTTRAKKPGTAAPPGTSNHGWGMAVDLDPASASWLSENGPRFGWINPDWASSTGSKPESWHLEFIAPELGAFTPPSAPKPLEAVKNELTKE